jgi:hypothetical protein
LFGISEFNTYTLKNRYLKVIIYKYVEAKFGEKKLQTKTKENVGIEETKIIFKLGLFPFSIRKIKIYINKKNVL